MIRALCRYYDILKNSDKGSAFPNNGYTNVKVNYIIFLKEDGTISGISECDKNIELPERTEKSGIDKNFIEHRPLYIFGLNQVKKKFEANDRTDKAVNSHRTFVDYNLKMIESIDSKIVNAYRNFMQNWIPENETENEYLLGIKKYNSSYCFALDGHPEILLHDDENIKRVWSLELQNRNESGTDNQIKTMCAISGKEMEIARTHKKIKAISGGNTTGGVFIGVNKEAEESYGKKQAYNNNISVGAMKKYVSAINYLLSEPSHRTVLGDMTLIYWAMSENDTNEVNTFNAFLGNNVSDGNGDNVNKSLDSFLSSARKGTAPKMDNFKVDMDVEFYILGITPNSSRVSVKLFYKNRFGNLLKNIIKHQEDLSLNEEIKNISIKRILRELVSPKSSKDKVPSPLEVSIIKAVLSGGLYPESMLGTVIRRVKTDSDEENKKYIKLNDVRVGIIKACLNRKRRIKGNKEVIDMALNKNNTNCGYLCGRLFAVLELIQERVSTNLNRTIRDTYFSTACSNPNITFNKLMKLSVHHQAKLDKGAQIYFDKLISEILDKLDNGFPSMLNLDEQGDFIVGYYHQRKDYFAKIKENKENNTEDNNENNSEEE